MRNIFTIFRREFKSYFISPIGYIFLIVFWLVSTSLYIWPFFRALFPAAEMFSYFSLLPIILSVFIPAVTMRLWAEEKKLNTFEMLQTFPMTSTQVVLGKYFASMAFYIIALVGSLPIPIMLGVLGNPDGGAIFSSYIGAFFLGALYLALGLFFSGFCNDQVVAYVVSLMALLGIYLLGADVLRDIFPFASYLRNILGVTDHYHEFTKGVIDTVHIIYFLVWIILFLFLNGFYVESRNRKGTTLLFSGALVLSLGIGLVFNSFISTQSFGRIDMTENSLYTLSPGTVKILKKLKAPVTVTLYISPKEDMPAGTEFEGLERDIVSKLEEMEVKSGNKMVIKTVHPRSSKYLEERQKDLEKRIAELTGKKKKEEEEKLEKEKEVEQQLFEKGVAPFNVGVASEIGKQSSQWVYSSIGLDYKEHDTEFIHQVVPASLERLEYQIAKRVFRLTQEKKPVIALVAPRTSIPDYLLRMYMQMGRPLPPQRDPFSRVHEILSNDYEVKRVQLTKESPLPGEFDMLIVISPSRLSERQLWEINKVIVEGIPTVIAANQHQFSYIIKNRDAYIRERDNSSGINDILDDYGVTLSKDILMSKDFVRLREGLTSEANPDMQMVTAVDSPLNIMVTSENMNKESIITNRLDKMFFRWGSPVEIDREKTEENKLKVMELISTGSTAWKESTAKFNANSRLMAKQETPSVLESYPCVVLAEGQFPNAFQGKERPEWPKQRPGMPPTSSPDEGPELPLEPAPGMLILIGAGDIFHDQLIGALEDTGKLLTNIVDYMTGSYDIISIRNKEMISRIIKKSKLKEAYTAPFEMFTIKHVTLWKIFVMGCFSIILVIGGVVYFVIRTHSRKWGTLRASAGGADPQEPDNEEPEGSLEE